MEELHRNGGVPRGWKFTLPGGDAARGRRVFADLECYKCHAVAGGNFPPAGADPNNAGPELTGMGPYHPAEYFAESVLDSNAVIVEGPGYTGPDGRSIMPGYADSMTVTQLVDLVAYLRSLTAGEPHGGMHGHDAPH
jgi:mono/diheme cytochrome c family protein